MKSLHLLYEIYISGFVGSFVAQSFFQGKFGTESSWGINKGWQTEIAIWNLGISVILIGLIKAELVSSIPVAGLSLLSFCFGTNHLLAYLRKGRKRSNLYGLLANLAGLCAIGLWFLSAG